MCLAHFPRLPLFDKLVIMSLCPALCLANIHGDLRYHFFRYPFASCPIQSYSNLYREVCCYKNSDLFNYRIVWHIQKGQDEESPPSQISDFLCKLAAERYKHVCSDDSIQILLKLAWIETSMIQGNFRRMYMESLEHNSAFISRPISSNEECVLLR